jgi:hypothetical protein
MPSPLGWEAFAPGQSFLLGQALSPVGEVTREDTPSGFRFHTLWIYLKNKILAGALFLDTSEFASI